ncbi:hypothetical protein TrRE_jg7430, partial [Triparma retinervis]
ISAGRARVDNYLLFSDLHVSPSTLPQCLSCLSHLSAVASTRPSTAILFLGDFYHTRGSLDVRCLNAVFPVMKKIAEANQVIMIPGNHDIVDLHTRQTSLDIFSTLPNCTVVKNPSKLHNAGLIPYLRSGISAPLASLACDPSVDTMFIHDSVVGGLLSGSARSASGIHPGAWGGWGGKVWAGHFHRPQDGVGGGRVAYVGSPYQVTAGEAGERKRFVWLDGGFKYDGEVELPRFGREYHEGMGGVGRAVEGDVVKVTVEEGGEGGEDIQEAREICEDSGAAEAEAGPIFGGEVEEEALRVVANVEGGGDTQARGKLEFGEVEIEGFASFKGR